MPNLGRRYLAAFLDGLVVIFGMVLIGVVFERAPASMWPLRAALFVVLWWGYEPGFTAFSTTLGQRLLGFRVRRADDPTKRISLPAAWLRYVVKLLLGIISFLTMGMTRQRRAIHDLVAGSIVLLENVPHSVPTPNQPAT